jgi:hypothetical protein
MSGRDGSGGHVGLGVLRVLLIGLGALLLAAGAVLGAVCGLGPFLRLAVPGALLIAGGLIERWRYKRLSAERPGPGWVATGERFVDVETGRPVSVYCDPRTGERRYVGS